MAKKKTGKKVAGKAKPEAKGEIKEEPVGLIIECPNCGKNAEAKEVEENIPNFGKIAISTLLCSSCGFKLNDIIALEQKDPVIYKVEIKNSKDLETKLVKSSTGTVRIDKLGVCIEPGPAAEGFITNIEGLLERVESAMKVLLDSKESGAPDEKKLARKEMERIKGARNPESSYTVMVEDPFGNSALIGQGVEKVKLSDEELKRLQGKVKELEEGEEDI